MYFWIGSGKLLKTIKNHRYLAKKEYTDKELIKGCCKGNLRFQELLYRRFYAFAMSVCLRYATSRDDALEILNDGFMKVFENISKHDQERPFKSWFRKILVNTALDRFRAGKRFRVSTVNEEVEVAGEPELSRWMEAEEILSLLSGLPDLYRLIFNLYEVEGYSHDEIAGMLDIAPGTSRSNLSRAKTMLRKSYTEKLNKPYNEAI